MSKCTEKTVKTLELDRVLTKLADFCSLADAKAQAQAIEPTFDFAKAQSLLEMTDDAYLLSAHHSAPSFSGTPNVLFALSRVELGSSLTAKELLEIASVLRTVRSVKKWRSDCEKEKADSIEHLFNALSPNKFLGEKISLAIKSEDEISDNASPLLANIRRKIALNSSKIRDSLDKIVKGAASKYLREAIITQRDGRFVVPVKSEYKNEIKGIIHDTSASGSTIFIEPISVVEANNDIRVLRSDEQDEIARILSELSASVAEFSESIKYSYSALCELDLVFAKAKLAFDMGAIKPKLNRNGFVYLKRARHPLISKKTVVPITVQLGKSYDQLIITGPNTGGKTVTLKTVGLLTLMAMCGLMIPADDSSEICVFGKVFADIGDEQSIEQSLSTFSSHIVNIVNILNECDGNSLILFDELCAGTDPVEGAALAKAILKQVSDVGAQAVATTHYPELKVYALDTDRVENASCEFNVETLKPTYRLIVGVPGSSNAFAISSRLGLPENIIKNADSYLSDDDLHFERVVKSLETERKKAEDERIKAANLRSQLAAAKKKSDNLEQELRIKRDKILEQSREKAESIVNDARDRASMLLNELEETKKKFDAKSASTMLEKARNEYKRSIKEMEENADPISENGNDIGEKLAKMPENGDIVTVASINREATVLKVDENEKKAFVAAGSIKLWVDIDDLRIKKSVNKKQIPKTRNINGIKSKQDITVSGEIDIRGMASDEAIMELDKYIDNAILSGITTITIIHGKGTGVLRKSVQSHLRTLKCIKSFRVGLFGEGENGVTIAELTN